MIFVGSLSISIKEIGLLQFFMCIASVRPQFVYTRMDWKIWSYNAMGIIHTLAAVLSYRRVLYGHNDRFHHDFVALVSHAVFVVVIVTMFDRLICNNNQKREKK